MIEVQAVRDVFQQRRLACFRRRDDEAALPFAERGEEVDDARGQSVRLRLELEHFVRIDRDQFGEGAARFAILLERHSFDLLQSDELDVVAGAARAPGQHQAGLQMQPLDDRTRHDGVAGRRNVIVRRLNEKAGAVRLDPEHAGDRRELAGRNVDRRRLLHLAGVALRLASAAAGTAAAPSAGTSARSIIVEGLRVAGNGDVAVWLALRCDVARIFSGCARSPSAPAALTRLSIVWRHANS